MPYRSQVRNCLENVSRPNAALAAPERKRKRKKGKRRGRPAHQPRPLFIRDTQTVNIWLEIWARTAVKRRKKRGKKEGNLKADARRRRPRTPGAFMAPEQAPKETRSIIYWGRGGGRKGKEEKKRKKVSCLAPFVPKDSLSTPPSAEKEGEGRERDTHAARLPISRMKFPKKPKPAEFGSRRASEERGERGEKKTDATHPFILFPVFPTCRVASYELGKKKEKKRGRGGLPMIPAAFVPPCLLARQRPISFWEGKKKKKKKEEDEKKRRIKGAKEVRLKCGLRRLRKR